MKVEVKIFNPRKTAKRIFSDDVLIYANTQLKAICDPYVPMDSGILSQNTTVTRDFVHYKSPYAHFQWEGKLYVDERGSPYAKRSTSKHPTGTALKYSKDKHPLATSHWEEAAMAAKGDQLVQNIEEYIKRK